MHIPNCIQWAAMAVLLCLVTACGKPGTEAPLRPVMDPAASPTPEPAPVEPGELALQTSDQLASYGIGYGTGATIAQDGVIEVDRRALIEGLVDGLHSARSQVDEEALRRAFAELDRRVQTKQDSMITANLDAALGFLERNSRRSGVRVTGSGLQFEILTASDQAEPRRPAPADTVRLHYHGTLVDGTVFDSSIRRGEPITIPLAGVIPGWQEALPMMSVGDRWRITLPPALGYGAAWTGSIPPQSVLVFEIQLLDVLGPAG